MSKRIGIGVIVAVGVAVGATMYLRNTKKAVERVVEPVKLRVPDLFPADTLLYAEIQGWQEAWKVLDNAYDRFDETAAGLALKRAWEKDRDSMPPDARKPLESMEAQLSKVEQRFGYRPTSRDFFEAYGRHTAFGLVPSPGTARPHLLAVILLPEENLAGLLQSKLSGASGVKPAAEALHRGFPVFVDNWEGVSLVYGIGRGHLFISDDVAPVNAALDRLADATDGENPTRPKSSLGDDPILARISPAGQPASQAIFYAKGEQKFALYDPDLAIVDEFVKTTMARAPGDAAVALAFSDAGMRSSLAPSKKPGSWKKGMPEGVYDFSAILAREKSAGPPPASPAWEALRKKPLWSEISELAQDTATLRAILKDALRDPSVIDDELLMRLPKDVKLVAELAENAMRGESSPTAWTTAFGTKLYKAKDGERRPQVIIMTDMDTVTSFAVAGGLDMLHNRFPDWVERTQVAGGLQWRLAPAQIEKLAASMDTSHTPLPMRSALTSVQPTLFLFGERLYFVTGEEAAADVLALVAGTARSLEDDALFNEAIAALPAGCDSIAFTRPMEQLSASWEPWRTLAVSQIEQEGEFKKDVAETLQAFVATMDAVVTWEGKVRATVSGSGPGMPDRASIILRDEVLEKTVPEIMMGPGKFGIADYLPGGTWLHHSWRLSPGVASTALRKAFVGALPGGEKRFEELLEVEKNVQELYDVFIEDLAENIEGEVGFNVSIRTLPANLKDKKLDLDTESVLLIPAVVCFAEVKDPALAMKGLRFLLEKIDGEFNGSSNIDEAFRNYQRYGGRQPWGSKFVVGALSGNPALALDIYAPHRDGRRYHVESIVVLSRGPYIFITNSLAAAQHAAGTKPGDAGTFAAQLRDDLGEKGLEPLASERHLYHSATFARQIQVLSEPGMREIHGITLGGHRGEPPPDRVEAHQRGWARVEELILDLFVEPGWDSSSWVRQGAKLTWTHRRIPELKK